MKGIDDYDYIKNLPFKILNHYTASFGKELPKEIDRITIDQIKDYIPPIEYFEKNGHKCRNICGVDCNYCYNFVDKLLICAKIYIARWRK